MHQDLNKQLAHAEVIVDRLAEQAAQESAMIDVLPLRYERNMVALSNYFPELAKLFSDYTPQRPFRFFCNENGIPNLLWLNDNVALYGDDPYTECKNQIDAILNSGSSMQCFEFAREDNPLEFLHVDAMNRMLDIQISASSLLNPISKIKNELPLSIMFGVGLGYQLAYFYESCRPEVFFVIEPDLDLFYASLFAFDWFSLLEYIDKEKLTFHIFLGQKDDEIMEDLAEAVIKRGAFLAAACVAFCHYPSDRIFGLMAKTKQEFFLMASGWGFFDDNHISLSHCIANVKNNVPFLLVGKSVDRHWQDIPVFIIGNGPSLDAAIETLKKCKNNVILLSCGSALSALHKAGIQPDIHVQVERTKMVPDSHRLLDEDYLKDILFLSLDVIHPECANQFNRVGLAFKTFEPGGFILKKNYPEVNKFDYLKASNPLVGNMGMSIACRLGFRDIYFFGIDNGYKDDEHHHSKFSFYFDDAGNAKEKLSSLVKPKIKRYIPGNFGGSISTTTLMIHSRKVMEAQIENYKNSFFHNCSDGAFIRGAKPTKIDEVIIPERQFSKDDLINHICNDVYSPIDIDVDLDKYSHLLEVCLFDELIDRLVSEWSNCALSKQDIIACMRRQFSYLTLVSASGHPHIYRFLIGSINYSFSQILAFIFKFDESEMLYLCVKDLIVKMTDYLSEMKVKYKDALISVDYKEHGMFDS